jgi:crotonobetaine/carnitine-CoA ligase
MRELDLMEHRMGGSGWVNAPSTTLLQVFEDALRSQGAGRPFLDYAGTLHTLGELDRRSIALAHGLRSLGVQAGQCVAAVFDSCVEQVLLLLATTRIGAVYVGINSANRGEFLRHAIAECAAPVVMADTEYAERVLQVADGLPQARVLLVKGAALEQAHPRLAVQALESAFVETTAPLAYTPRPTDTAMVVFTGGTTGPSKGCMISQNYFCSLAASFPAVAALTAHDVVWTPLPAFHFNQPANMWAALMVGARFAVYPRFSVSNFWPEIERTGATVALLLGTMLTMLGDAPDNPALLRCRGQLRVVGGVPFPPDTQRIWRERFGVRHIVHAQFGLTECCPIANAPLGVAVPQDSCGLPNENFEVMLVDEFDNQVPVGQPGEIVARPRKPFVMFDGYWGRPEATLKTLRNGWFHTGDIGRFDAQGFLYFVDRGKDYLRRRGENISSTEMEAVFRAHPDLAEVTVHAVKAEHPEDEIKVTAVLRAGAALTEEALARWSIERVPYFAVPRFVEFRDELPRSPVGRILKVELRAEGITARTWDREKSDLVVPKR